LRGRWKIHGAFIEDALPTNMERPKRANRWRRTGTSTTASARKRDPLLGVFEKSADLLGLAERASRNYGVGLGVGEASVIVSVTEPLS